MKTKNNILQVEEIERKGGEREEAGDRMRQIEQD